MNTNIGFMNDVLFKYCIGKDNASSQALRNFIIRNVLHREDNDLRVLNPELIPEMLKQKNVILDILLEGDTIKVGIDMQATSMNVYLYKRFQQYLARLCSDQLSAGEKYNEIKPSCMIVFVKDRQEGTSSLIIEYVMSDEADHVEISYALQRLYFIQLPYIEEIVKKKEVLSEFEALIYLIYRNEIEGIKYEEEEGIIKMMKEKKEHFVKEEPALYSEAQQRTYFTIDYDQMLKEAKKEYQERGLEQGLEQGLEEGIEQGRTEATKRFAILQIQAKYHEDTSSWIERYTLEQLERLLTLCFEDLSYEELKKRICELSI